MAKEYIEREAVCSDCNNQKICVDKSKCPVGRAPAADVVEVVRCKDCKRCVPTKEGFVCGHALPTKSLEQYFQTGTDIMAIVKPDDFCSYGERRNNDG